MDLVKPEIAPKLLTWMSTLTEEHKKVSALLTFIGPPGVENDSGPEGRKEVQTRRPIGG
jgi:hypothetical protein